MEGEVKSSIRMAEKSTATITTSSNVFDNRKSKVTDYEWYDDRRPNLPTWLSEKDGKIKNRRGYAMDYYLAINLLGLPRYLRAAWDVVGIISGHGKVRIGKSTMAQQVGYLCAWLVAGGQMKIHSEEEIAKDPNLAKRFIITPPKREVHWSLENIVFTPEDLMQRAQDLFKKYGKHQVIIYDEGRQGLDSARSMEATNKILQDFFQECGFMGHIILVVLPNFFKLHEDYAVNRSLFLIDVFADKNLQRGYFNFYNESTKEFLYFNGKKKLGSSLKYRGSAISFSGKFTGVMTLDKEAYEKAKMEGLKKKQIKTKELLWKKQRDAAIYLLQRSTQWEVETISREMTVTAGHYVSSQAIRHAIQNITHDKTETS